MFPPRTVLVLLLLPACAFAQAPEHRRYLPHQFLRQLNLDEERRENARMLIGYLNAESFSDRQFAQRELLDMKIVPINLLEAAAESRDPEVRNFGRRLKHHILINLEDPIIRALGEIRKERMTGWTSQILQALPYCHSPDMFYQAELALSTTLIESDSAVFKEGLKSARPRVRRMSVLCLHRLQGAEALPMIEPVMRDEHEGVRLAAAQVLDRCRDLRCLDIMVGLLASEDRDVRGDAITFLRQLALRSFGYFINASGEENRASIEKWTAWAKTEGHRTLISVYRNPDTPRMDPALLAAFTFDGDVLNRVDTKRAVARNLPYRDKSLYFNGIYGFEHSADDSYYFGWNMPEWNRKALTITLEMKPETFAPNRLRTPYTFFVFGTRTRWFGARRNHAGKLEITFNNQRRVIEVDRSLEAGRWHKLSVALDLEKQLMRVCLNDQVSKLVRLQPHLILQQTVGDDRLTFTNYADSSVFRGWVHGVKVYSRALSDAELALEHASGRHIQDD